MHSNRKSSLRIPQKKLRKPSSLRATPKNKKWWRFGLSEGALTKTKLFVGVLVTLVALVTGLLTLLKVHASDEETFKRYADRIVAWHYKTELWHGYFSNFFEGIVNLEEMNLSHDSSMTLALQASGNTIDGGMSEKRLCGIFPPKDFKLVRGTISHFGNSAEIQIYEFVQGHTKIYAEFKLHHDGLVLEVTPKWNSRWFGRDTIRLIQHPESTIDTGFKEMEGTCKEVHARFREMLRESYERLVEEGALKRRTPPDETSSGASAPHQ